MVRVLKWAVLVFMTAGSAAHAADYELHGFEAEAGFEVLVEPASGPEGPQLFVVESDPAGRECFVSRYDLGEGWERRYRIALGQGVYLTAVIDADSRPRFLVYRDQGLFALNERTAELRRVADVPSMYRGQMEEALTAVPVVQDLNGANRDDLLLPNFDGWRVVLQRPDGSFEAPMSLGPPPLMGIGAERNVYFRARQPYLLDQDLDGVRDLAFWSEGSFALHHLGRDGFIDAAVRFQPNLAELESDLFAMRFREEEAPEERRVLDAVSDLDGDGTDDVVVMALTGKSVFGMATRFDVHLGQRSDGGLSFERDPSSVIRSEGVQIDSERIDLDGDGAQEIVVTSVDFGVGTVIRALLARRVGLDLGIYRMRDGAYSDRPTISRKVTATVSFSEGAISVPAILAADVDGDGRKDLLVQESEDEMRIFAGIDGPDLFAKRGQRMKLPLPRDREEFTVFDLDADGRDDLVLVLGGVTEGRRIATVRFR